MNERVEVSPSIATVADLTMVLDNLHQAHLVILQLSYLAIKRDQTSHEDLDELEKRLSIMVETFGETLLAMNKRLAQVRDELDGKH